MLRSHHQHDQHDLFVCLMALCAMREVLVPQNPLAGGGGKKSTILLRDKNWTPLDFPQSNIRIFPSIRPE